MGAFLMPHVDLDKSSPDSVESEGPQRPPVVIAIVGYRNHDNIRSCLSALAKSNDQNFVISICENGGSDAFKELILRIANSEDTLSLTPNIIDHRIACSWVGALKPRGQQIFAYMASSNVGFAGGVNLIIRQQRANHEWSAIWLLNPDTEPAPGALEALVNRARENAYGIVGSRIILQSTGKVTVVRWTLESAHCPRF